MIYGMTSNGCRENYIGQAGTNADRVRVHKYKKQRGFRLLVKLRAVNILMCAGEAVFILFFLLFTIPEESDPLRRAKEQYFINKFVPKLNR